MHDDDVARAQRLIIHNHLAILRQALHLAGHGGRVDVQAQSGRAHRVNQRHAARAVVQLQRQQTRVRAAERKYVVAAKGSLGQLLRAQAQILGLSIRNLLHDVFEIIKICSDYVHTFLPSDESSLILANHHLIT